MLPSGQTSKAIKICLSGREHIALLNIFSGFSIPHTALYSYDTAHC